MTNINTRHHPLTKLLLIILCTVLLLGITSFPPSADATPTVRDRVEVVNSKVLTDIGTPLRGGPMTLSKEAYCDPINDPDSNACENLETKCSNDVDQCGTNWTLNPDNWVRMSKLGINTGRIVMFDYNNQSTWNPANPGNLKEFWTLSEQLPYLDIAVQNAEDAGMYAVINYHDVGNFDPVLLNAFWTAVAPRYKDRTHVIYEMVNEPGTITTSTTGKINDMADAYEIIRNAAPDTHVIHMSVAKMNANLVPVVNAYRTRINNHTSATLNFANGKDSVGFHTYGTTNDNNIVLLRNSFPVVATELGYYGTEQPAVKILEGTQWHHKVMENLGISWFDWKAGRKDIDFVDDYQHRMLADARNSNYAWTSDTFSGGFKQEFNDLPAGSAVGNWTVSGTATIANNPSTTNRSVRLFDDDALTKTTMYRDFGTQTSQVSVSFSFLQPTKTDFQAQMRNGTTKGPVFITEGGSLKIIDGSGVKQLVQLNYAVNTWFKIVLAANIETDTFDVFVNGTLKLANAEFNNNVASLDNMYLETGLTGVNNTLIDFVRVNNP